MHAASTAPRRRSFGFSLLEVVVAMAILGLALMAIFDLNAGAVRMHAYTKKMTVASLLARSKMTDIEQQLHDEGFSMEDEEEDGDFSDEGWPSYKWRARILAPKTQGMSPDQLLAALFNIPMGLGGGDEGGGDLLSGIGAMFGGSAGGDAEGMSGMAGMMGPMAGLAQGQFTQFVEQITQSVREVHLTVYWKDGKEVESVDLVTHVVLLNGQPDKGRNVSGAPGTGTPAANMDPNAWVDAQTGQQVPAQNVIQAPGGGGFIDKNTGRPVVTYAQYLQMHGLSAPPGGAGPGQVPGGAVRPQLNIPRPPGLPGIPGGRGIR